MVAKLLTWFRPLLCRYGRHPEESLEMSTRMGLFSKQLILKVGCRACGKSLYDNTFNATEFL